MVRGRWAGAVHGTSEGSFSIPLDKLDHALEVIAEAASQAGLRLGTDMGIYIDYGRTHCMHFSGDG